MILKITPCSWHQILHESKQLIYLFKLATTFTEDKQIKLAQETASSWLVTSESNDTATTVSYTCILLLIDANIV